MRLLIMTAKKSGFNAEQIETTYRSLTHLRDILQDRSDIEIIWRVTQNLHRDLNVRNTVSDVTSSEFHDLLHHVDAVITTPSTAMLEAMLFGHPVALLDYHNCPHYIPAAWQITSKEQILPVVEDLRTAPLNRMLYQDYCLHDALSCRTPALPRMVQLIERMIHIKRQNGDGGNAELVFPYRLLDDPNEHISWPNENFDLQKLYSHHSTFGCQDMTTLQTTLETALGTIEKLHNKIEVLEKPWKRVSVYKLAMKLKKRLNKVR
jgi:hypothetical protein